MIAVSRSTRIAQSVKSVPLSIQVKSDAGIGLAVEGQEDDPAQQHGQEQHAGGDDAGRLFADQPPVKPQMIAPTRGAKRRIVSMCLSPSSR
jgi:hypothetical protein